MDSYLRPTIGSRGKTGSNVFCKQTVDGPSLMAPHGYPRVWVISAICSKSFAQASYRHFLSCFQAVTLDRLRAREVPGSDPAYECALR